MIVQFSKDLYEYLRLNGSVHTLKSKIYDLNNSRDNDNYKILLDNFKRWIFYYKSYELEDQQINEVFFDFDLMMSEWSTLYGIKSGEEIRDAGNFGSSKTSATKSIESIIEESLKNLDRVHNSPDNVIFRNFVQQQKDEWCKSFVINCVPNVLNGNYVNVPSKYVDITESDSYDFIDVKDYFFQFLNIVPLKIHPIKIAGDDFFNIVNISIVPLFITLERTYIFG